ncbi:PIN domain-containing protein [Luteitalea sp.]|uniref:PIN domain-containing protein n=1 Tax=Luteitalea sp. TaxID=2004800 RepID=UPI0025B8247F|nr:PIN domain-containing protein [Luteitalea sp.]
MIAVDTSVMVAAFASWHEGHTAAAAVVAGRPRIPAHVVIETFSVLTRLPPPHRAPADVVEAFLAHCLGEAPLVLPARSHLGLIEMASREGLTGGAVYDALIAATVLHAGATLVTRDQRARRVYDCVRVPYELLD